MNPMNKGTVLVPRRFHRKTLKLLIICPAFRERRFCERWHLLSQLHDDVDVTLLAPRYWSWGDGTDGFGKLMEWHGEPWEDTRFRIRLVDMPSTRIGWLSYGVVREIVCRQPDMVYYIGHDLESALYETMLATRLLAPRAKMAAFTMRGLPHDLNKRSRRWRWWLVRKCCHAMFCHYPDARRLIQEQGFPGAVYIQTQIGVDARIYCRDENAREQMRLKYGLGDAFVFGSATRLSLSKGLMEILAALPREGNWRFLMLGSGPKEEEEAIRAEIVRRGLGDRIVAPGAIEWRDMAAHWSAMDCMLHVPRTTPTWVDTFPVAVVQAMASSLPVIGNTSGAVPYQLGDEGIVVPEGDVDALRAAMLRVMNDPGEARLMGDRLRQRVLKSFDITHLSHCFHATLLDVVRGVFDPGKMDQARCAGQAEASLNPAGVP